MPIAQHDLVEAIQDLEPLPPTAARLASLLCRADWEIRDVEEAIAFDQALTAKLLRLCNSALWFRGHAIATVRDAVMRLGSGTIVGLAMGAGVQRTISRAIPQYGLREGELWAHSVAATLAASVLAAKSDVEVPIESFAAALLHDVGKLVMARYLDPDRLFRIEEVRRTEGFSLHDAELAVLGLDHAEIGGMICAHWQLPERLVTGVAHHHAPAESSDPIASVVHVTDVVARKAQTLAVGVVRGGDVMIGDERAAPAAEALQLIGLPPDQLELVTREVADKLTDVLRRFA